MEEGETKEENEDEVMEEEREIKDITKAVESIESPRFNWNKTVAIETPKWWKGVKEEMNGGESGKREEILEICETGENILPQNTKSSGFKIPENGKWWKWMTIIKEREQHKNEANHKQRR